MVLTKELLSLATSRHGLLEKRKPATEGMSHVAVMRGMKQSARGAGSCGTLPYMYIHIHVYVYVYIYMSISASILDS